MASRPSNRAAKNERSPASAGSEGALKAYVSRLQAEYGKSAKPTDETRRLVDASMGSVTLTELLYNAREDGAV